MSSALLKLRAPFEKCDTQPFVNGSGGTLVGSAFFQVGSQWGIVLEDTPDTEPGLILIYVPAPGIMVPKDNTVPFAVGDDALLDTANLEIDATGPTVAGSVYAAALAADTEVQIILDRPSS